MQRFVRLTAMYLMASAMVASTHVSLASADSVTVLPFPLPTRRNPVDLAHRSRQVAAALAARVDGKVQPPGQTDPTLDARIGTAIHLARSGALDQAAEALDQVLARASDHLSDVGDHAQLISAYVERMAIALARDERDVANRLARQLLQYDPGFVLEPAERSPSMRAAVDRAREVASDQSLAVATLGPVCKSIPILLVARGTASGATEITRFDRCQLVARVSATRAHSAADIAESLDPRVFGGGSRRPPLYKRPWFWVAVGAGVIAGSAAIYVASRDGEGLRIEPHL